MTKAKFRWLMFGGTALVVASVFWSLHIPSDTMGLSVSMTQFVFTDVYSSFINVEYGWVMLDKPRRVLFPFLHPMGSGFLGYAVPVLIWLAADAVLNVINYFLLCWSILALFASFLLVLVGAAYVFSNYGYQGHIRVS